MNSRCVKYVGVTVVLGSGWSICWSVGSRAGHEDEMSTLGTGQLPPGRTYTHARRPSYRLHQSTSVRITVLIARRAAKAIGCNAPAHDPEALF